MPGQVLAPGHQRPPPCARSARATRLRPVQDRNCLEVLPDARQIRVGQPIVGVSPNPVGIVPIVALTRGTASRVRNSSPQAQNRPILPPGIGVRRPIQARRAFAQWDVVIPLGIVFGLTALFYLVLFLATYGVLTISTGTASARTTLRILPAVFLWVAAVIITLAALRHAWRTLQAKRAIRTSLAGMGMRTVRCRRENPFVDCGSFKQALLFSALFYEVEAETIGSCQKRRYMVQAAFVPVVGLLRGLDVAYLGACEVSTALQQIRLSWICGQCAASNFPSSARCGTPGCGFIRLEFKPYERLLVPEPLRCAFSGATTDLQLPGGDPIWPPLLLEFVEAGWLGADLNYTGTFHETHPIRRQGN
jgi:hypothetical protein